MDIDEMHGAPLTAGANSEALDVPAVTEKAATVIGNPVPLERLADLHPHPFGHERYLRLVNELTQSEAEFRQAGYRELAYGAAAARQAVQQLWRDTREIENFPSAKPSGEQR